jgi:hypothetical protein
MKTMHILALGIMALALALASGSAEALLELKVEDPALTDGVFQVEDNGDGDFNLLEGMISARIDNENCKSTIINAISSQDETAPRLVLDLEGYCSLSDSITFSLTDTDFEIFEGTPGRATVFGVQGAGSVASFTFSGDGANQPFESGFTITTGSVSEPEIIAGQDVTVATVGSLTLSGVVENSGSVQDFLDGTFTMVLQVGKSAEINCPPNILGQTVSRLGKVEGGCVIQDSTIEDGDVKVTNVASGFTIVNSVVRNGNIDIEDVSGPVTVNRNRVTNGDIEIKRTATPSVTRNIVNGNMIINENDTPFVARNAFSNGSMIVRNNTGQTVVLRNTGTANLEVDENAHAVVTDNTTNRDISCKDNVILDANGNEADRRIECPKQEDGGLFD